MNILTLFATLLILCLLIVVHELGHYLAARALGIPVAEFAIGFGKSLYQKSGKNTVFSVRLLPLGGYCRFFDDDEAAANGKLGFKREKIWKRLIVFVAGPAMNILLAVVLMAALLICWGDYAVSIQSVNAGSPAERAGLQSGDIFISIAGEQVAMDFSAMDNIGKADPSGVDMTVFRNGERMPIFVSDIYNEQEGRNLIGVNLLLYEGRRPFTFIEAAQCSLDFITYFAREMVNVFAGLFTSPETASEQFAGPVALVSIVEQAVRSSFEVVLRLIVLISANLGFINLVPIPGLDGAQILLGFIELIARRRIPEKAEIVITLAGFAFLTAVTILLTMKDITGLMGG